MNNELFYERNKSRIYIRICLQINANIYLFYITFTPNLLLLSIANGFITDFIGGRALTGGTGSVDFLLI